MFTFTFCNHFLSNKIIGKQKMLDWFSYVSEQECRFIAGLILTFIFSATIRKRSGIPHFLCSILIMYIVFDYLQMAYVCTSVVINISLIYVAHATDYQLTVFNFLILYIFKIKGRSFDPRISGTCDVSGMLMLNTIKMSYLGKEFDRKKHKMSDLIGYILFVPGLILGPTCTFLEYVDTPYPKSTTFPYQTFCISLLFLPVVKMFDKYYNANVLFLKNTTFAARLVNLYLYNFGQRCRFYFAWFFSNGCYLMQGFDNMLNIDFIGVETARSIKDLSKGWNIKTNKWLKECYFDKLKHRNVFLASFVTFTVSALWHGINLGYLIMFLSFCVSIPIVKSINTILITYTPWIYPVVSRIQMLFFVMYFSIPFFLLDVKKLLHVWQSVYFFGHVYCIAGFCMYLLTH